MVTLLENQPQVSADIVKLITLLTKGFARCNIFFLFTSSAILHAHNQLPIHTILKGPKYLMIDVKKSEVEYRM